VKALRIRHSTALPVREISALTTRPGESGVELMAVSDEEFAVITAELDAELRPAATQRHDLSQVLPASILQGEGGSGFEGIAADGERTVFVLQEEEARILVLAADMKALLHTIALAVPEAQPRYGATWRDVPNKRGEGLALMTGGHVLIAKQDQPVCLIEFGPAGDAPRGIDADTLLAPGAAFERPEGEASELVPLADWPLGESTGEALPSINDVAVGDDRRVYLLSSKGQTIARLEPRLDPGERASADGEWKIDGELPGGEDAHPEGLALLGGSHATVAVDSKVAGDNVVVGELD